MIRRRWTSCRKSNENAAFLKSASGAHPLRFNVSHSQGLAAIAIARDREVGIDIEHFQTAFAWEEIAASFFSAQEVNVLYSLPV